MCKPQWVPNELFVFDFDGTLAHRPGMWTQCLVEVLDFHDPGHGVTVDDIRPHLRGGFPWHRPEIPHPELANPDAWWAKLGQLIDHAYQSVGVASSLLGSLRTSVREHYCDPGRFQLYPDTLIALKRVRENGARSVILSNHVPELTDIVDQLGLGGLVDDVLSSAVTGFEKPHPEAFRAALGAAPPSRSWMIGDNPDADKGAPKHAAFGRCSFVTARPTTPRFSMPCSQHTRRGMRSDCRSLPLLFPTSGR